MIFDMSGSVKEIKINKRRGADPCRYFHGDLYGTGAMPIMTGME